MSDVACVLLTPVPFARRALRRFTYSDAPGVPPCTKPQGHDARAPLGDIAILEDCDTVTPLMTADVRVESFLGDPRWPLTCEACGWLFSPAAQWQVDWHPLYTQTGITPPEGARADLVTLRDAPAGSMWFADWFVRDLDGDEYRGPDGHCLVVRLPNGHDWMVDSRASNCDSPCARCRRPFHEHRDRGYTRAFPDCTGYLESRPHKCWVRHGTPPAVHVDKVGVTCTAGGGSILSGDYHGFLRQGRLVQC